VKGVRRAQLICTPSDTRLIVFAVWKDPGSSSKTANGNPMNEFEDQVALRRLASVYCTYVDDGDAQRMASLFVPGGRLVVYPPGARPGAGKSLRSWEGVEGFRKLIAVLGQSYLRWVHFLGNHWVDINGAHAAGEAYLLACHLRNGARGQEEEVAVIRYKDIYMRMSEGWRFRERNAYRQWTTVRPIDAGRHEIDAVLQAKPEQP
jgi:SnoaL-like domain